MLTTIRYTLLTAIRDWLFVIIIAALGAAVFLSHFLGSTVMIERNEMVTEFTAATTRVVLVIGMIVFVCFHIRRAFENKEIDLMLSRPISRNTFIFSYWLGFTLAALILLVALAFYMVFFYQYNYVGLSYWIASMAMEVMIVTAFAVFASVILSSSVSSVLVTGGFYVVSRMVGFFGYVLEKNYTGADISLDWFSQKVIWLVSWLMPRLDLFAKSNWLIYGVDFSEATHLLPFIQTLLYIPILLIFAAIDFKRKQF